MVLDTIKLARSWSRWERGEERMEEEREIASAREELQGLQREITDT